MGQTQIPASQVKDGSIKDADIATDAAISVSKLESTASRIVGNKSTGGIVLLTAAEVKTILSLSNVTNDAQIAKSIGTTKGDIIVYTASGTPVRLGVGADGTVLTADNTETAGVKFATVGGAVESLTSDVTDYTVSNTTVESTLSKIDIPANTLADGDFIEIRTETHITNSTATGEYVTMKLTDGTNTQILAQSSDNTLYISSNLDRLQEFVWYIRRDGSTLYVYFSRHGEATSYFNQSSDTGASAHPFYMSNSNVSYLITEATYGNALSITPTFSNIITISWKFKWDTASASLSASFGKSRAFHFKA